MTALGMGLVLTGLVLIRVGARLLPEWLLGTRTARRIEDADEGLKARV
jgi:hypothetical protein